MTDYIVRFTDTNTTPITVAEDTVDRDSVGVVLVGRVFQNYGQDINEDLLNLLENFACPESAFTTDMYDAEPDLNETSKNQLSNPVHGQFWFNTTRELMYFYDATKWVPIPPRGSYAANWGQIIHGESLPRPLNQQGYLFPYDECIWSVSPASINGTVDMLNCNTDASALVTMQYRYANTETIVSGIANYLIIGITGNVNNGNPSPAPVPNVDWDNPPIILEFISGHSLADTAYGVTEDSVMGLPDMGELITIPDFYTGITLVQGYSGFIAFALHVPTEIAPIMEGGTFEILDSSGNVIFTSPTITYEFFPGEFSVAVEGYSAELILVEGETYYIRLTPAI